MKIESIKYSALYNELKERRDILGAELSRVTAEQLAISQNAEPEFGTPGLDDAGARRIAELLGQAPQPVPPTKRERLIQAAERMRDLRTAIGRLDSQIEVERHSNHFDYRAGLMPEHRARLKAVVDAMQKVHAATMDVHDLAMAIEREGVSISNFPSFSPSLLGAPVDPHGSMARLFREAVEMKLIAAADVPKELQYR